MYALQGSSWLVPARPGSDRPAPLGLAWTRSANKRRNKQVGVRLAGLTGPRPSHVQTQACVLGSAPHCPFPLEPTAWESLVSLLEEREFRAIPEAESS